MDASYHIGLLSMFSHVTVISSGNRNGFCPVALQEDLNEFDWFVPGKLVFVSAAFVLSTEKEGVEFVSWLKGGVLCSLGVLTSLYLNSYSLEEVKLKKS